jgi:hypothetical protein
MYPPAAYLSENGAPGPFRRAPAVGSSGSTSEQEEPRSASRTRSGVRLKQAAGDLTGSEALRREGKDEERRADAERELAEGASGPRA